MYAEYDVMKLEAKLEGIKECRSCKRPVSLSKFNKNCRTADGYQSSCQECARGQKLKQRYNITTQDKQRLYCEQNGKCALCENSIDFNGKNTHVDHCHTTGRVRGILCHNCNTALGKLGDTPERLLAAYLYVTKQQ